MEFKVEGRRPVGRPRRTWLESVEVDMSIHCSVVLSICRVCV